MGEIFSSNRDGQLPEEAELYTRVLLLGDVMKIDAFKEERKAIKMSLDRAIGPEAKFEILPTELMDRERARREVFLRSLLRYVESLEKEKQGGRDPLTGVLRSDSFLTEVEKSLRRLRNPSGPTSVEKRDSPPKPKAFLFIDVDDLGGMNDNIGHVRTDEVLQKIVRRLKLSIRQGDLLGRLGGDEFAILLQEIDGDGLKRAEEIRQAVKAEPISIDDIKITPTVSIGVTIIPPVDNRGLREIVMAADAAHYQAKKGGKDVVHLAVA